MMNLKRNTVLMLTLSAGIFLFAGCGATGGKSDSSESSQSMSVIAESEEQTGDCYVTITDGDDISEYPVKAYGEEFTLPDYDTTKEGKFYGWLGFSGLYQPGDLVVAEEFMEFEALRSTPGADITLYAHWREV